MKGFTITLILFFGVVSVVVALSMVAPMPPVEDGIVAPMPPPEDGIGRCPGRNEVFNPCGGCFVEVCGVSPPRGIACAAVCRPRCECREGFIRQSADGPCIPKGQCKSSGTKNCGNNEEWKDCGSPCEPTCEEPQPVFCRARCVAGCFCKEDFVRQSPNGSCICKEDCRRRG